MSHLDRLLRKQIAEQQAREIEEQEAEGHFRTAKQPAAEPDEEPDLSMFTDNCTGLQAAFAVRLGLRDPDKPYLPKPPKFFDDNRADRRARRRRVQTLRSYSRMFAKDREPPSWATTQSG